MKRSTIVLLTLFLVLLADQVLKIWIKTNMHIGEEFSILGLNWARIHFVENEGMAFGVTLGGNYGKLLLSIFRIIVVGVLGVYIYRLIKEEVSKGFIFSLALIMAGAIGNIIDSMFYGMIFSESLQFHGGTAELFPDAGGYAPFLYGKVVDMFYFPMWTGTFPDWFPFNAGKPFTFFRPVFNLADSAISVGVGLIVLFYRDFLKHEDKQPSVEGNNSSLSDNTEPGAVSEEVV